jgi:hypothetical protein
MVGFELSFGLLMSRPLRNQYPGTVYHVMAKRSEKERFLVLTTHPFSTIAA